MTLAVGCVDQRAKQNEATQKRQTRTCQGSLHQLYATDTQVRLSDSEPGKKHEEVAQPGETCSSCDWIVLRAKTITNHDCESFAGVRHAELLTTIS